MAIRRGRGLLTALLLTALLLTACHGGTPTPRAQAPAQTAAQSVGPDSGQVRLVQKAPGSFGYAVRLPPDYDTHRDAHFPTIVFLHGVGEIGNGSARDLGILLGAGLPRLAASHQLPPQARGFIILMPQTPVTSWDPHALHTWLAGTLPAYRVDPDRLYLTGLSMGGGGVVSYLDSYGDTNEFAAAAPVAGNWLPSPTPLALPSCPRLAATPIWAFSGALDTVARQLSVNLVTYLNRHCNPRAPDRLTIFLSTYHNSWDRTYDLAGTSPGSWDAEFDPYQPDLYVWFLAHRLSGRADRDGAGKIPTGR